ncbi:MAG: NYN domain-containing protein [Nanoarchaeota archaeon]|nr:NYN domain-containing protein [Nanoarchaeota archaeon]MBU1321904.1 NYN domain-containing protein [Nanoarchaeota archaeon]MBU1598427.1 NYN domain-containing protein [Nanoarchaeota archaeon]MBU2441053.1 NYN domain-containing protein [Nanoarchaeota archaeon]
MKKAIFFVDANNWYHNVKKFFPPGDIDIKKIAELLADAKGYELVEIRWYASTPSIKDGERMYYKHMSYLGHLEKSGIKVIKRKLQRLSNEEIIKKKKETIENLYLCEHCKPLLESVFLDLADIKKKEKGIDIWVAVDMLRKCLIEKECEVCVLISGDADFVPALELITKNGNEVLTSMVPWGYSTELRKKFPFFMLRRETLMKCFKEYKDKK